VTREEVEPVAPSEPVKNEVQIEYEKKMEEYLQRTGHQLSLSTIASRLSAATFGGIWSTQQEEETRTRFQLIAKFHSKLGKPRDNAVIGSPTSSPAKKKTKSSSPLPSPMTFATPQSVSTLSKRSNKSSYSSDTAIERHVPENSQIAMFAASITQLTNEMASLRAEVSKQSTQINENDARVTALAKKIDSGELRSILRKLQTEAAALNSSQKRYTKLRDRKIAKELKGEDIDDIAHTAEMELENGAALAESLQLLRDQAKEQADIDGVVLTELQLCNEV
jgi:hypothetical protein